jgi:nucleoside-diphosphate-sugar epimerase
MHEAWLLLLDNTKAKILLWRTPKYNVNEVLQRTLKYYKTYYDNWDMVKAALEEISQFI